MLALPEDGTEALKHGGVLIKYFNAHMNNKQYKMHCMYIKKLL